MRIASPRNLLRTFYALSSTTALVAARHQQPLKPTAALISSSAFSTTPRPMSSFFSGLMGGQRGESAKSKNQFPDTRNEAEWEKKMTPEQYRILRQEGTEMPGSSEYTGKFGTAQDPKLRTGVFKCAGCETPLYSTETKFASGCGWPAFYAGLPGKVGEGKHNDGSSRDEIWCTNCGGHLGHVFRGEGNMETYKIPKDDRHCVNGAAMTFEQGPTSKV